MQGFSLRYTVGSGMGKKLLKYVATLKNCSAKLCAEAYKAKWSPLYFVILHQFTRWDSIARLEANLQREGRREHSSRKEILKNISTRSQLNQLRCSHYLRQVSAKRRRQTAHNRQLVSISQLLLLPKRLHDNVYINLSSLWTTIPDLTENTHFTSKNR